MATSAQIRQQLVEALQLDLIGPSWEDVARRHEKLPQPPSIWYTTGFLVPNTFQEEAGRPPEGDAPSYADQAGEDPSNDAAIRQEEREAARACHPVIGQWIPRQSDWSYDQLRCPTCPQP